MSEKFAIQLMRENLKNFKETPDGSFKCDYYGSTLAYVVIDDLAHVSLSMRDGEIFTGKIKRQYLFNV